jgi:hypothetical protein
MWWLFSEEMDLYSYGTICCTCRSNRHYILKYSSLFDIQRSSWSAKRRSFALNKYETRRRCYGRLREIIVYQCKYLAYMFPNKSQFGLKHLCFNFVYLIPKIMGYRTAKFSMKVLLNMKMSTASRSVANKISIAPEPHTCKCLKVKTETSIYFLDKSVVHLILFLSTVTQYIEGTLIY